MKMLHANISAKGSDWFKKEPITYSYEPEVNAFKDWKKINIDGKVGLDHTFTYNGLEKLLTAAEAMTMAEGITVNNFGETKSKIMWKANKLKEDWTSLKHADYAREAFIMTADVLGKIARDSRFKISDAWISKLSAQAKMIKPEVKLTDQASTVQLFFDTAEYIVNDLVTQANALSGK